MLTVWVGAACSAPPVSPVPPPQSIDRRAAVQATLDAITSAVQRRDRDAFLAHVSPVDPVFAEQARWLLDNLTRPPFTALSFQAEGLTGQLTGPRQAVVPGGWLQQVSVVDELPGDVAPAEHELWLTFVGASALLAGVADTPAGAPEMPRPLWLLEPITVTSAGRVTVVSGGAATGWPARTRAAAAAVRRQLAAPVGARWTGGLVVEIPTDERTFERVIGAAPGSYAQIAAVAWPEGPDAAKSAVRIIVNSTLADRLTGEGMAVLLTHEATHVATRSADSPAPMWLVEGFADFVAYRSVPSAAGAAAAALLADIRAHGVPRTLPPNTRFHPNAADLPLTYAQAWLACRFVAEKYSLLQLNRLYAAADAGKPTDEAIRTVLGVSLAEFTRGWRAYLRHQAGT